MLLRNTISNTKMFFKNTLQNFKSLLSGGYEKLPKTKTTPVNNPFSSTTLGDSKMQSSFKELENFYTDFTNRWDLDAEKAKKGSIKKVMKEEENPMKDEVVCNRSSMKFGKEKSVNAVEQASSSSYRSCLVAQKLKEMKLMDVNNVDHVLDIEEVLHYYSRLTCPAYRDIIDRFFVHVYSEFFQSSISAGNGDARKLPLVTL